uniref:C2 domain-containing protein n=1 Tax=Neogobius melanostomus TaxID=47308 RepID=A0A8C6T190_9GOBI
MSSLSPDEDQKWLPTHVQVTVLKGRGLRGKGKHGTSDVYTIIQLGKEKYSTCVVEKTTEPDWREECTFELQPGALASGGGSELVLTVMHRALIGLDVFLGQAVIPLETVFTESRGVKNAWYRLNSKTGKKEKERGEIQVTVQFTRNNLTASMYDLVMKDKGTSTFSKLKERIKGKRHSKEEEDSSSAILPGGYGSLVRMRQRLPSDGGGEEYYEDDEGERSGGVR